MATAPSLGDWSFEELTCTSSADRFGVYASPSGHLYLHVRITPRAQWSLVAATLPPRRS